MKKLISLILLTLASTFAIVGVSSTAANAVTVCSGTQIYSKYATYNGTNVGLLRVFYNASTGNNCAQFEHVGPSVGQTRYTSVVLQRCSQTNPGNGCTVTAQQSDAGQYSSYAGPVSVYAPGNCVQAAGEIYWGGGYRQAISPVIGC